MASLDDIYIFFNRLRDRSSGMTQSVGIKRAEAERGDAMMRRDDNKYFFRRHMVARPAMPDVLQACAAEL